MINTYQIFEELKETFEAYQAERLVKIFAKIYEDLANTVTKAEFRELTEIVKLLSERVDRLAKAQEKTEETLENFKKTVEENFNRVWKSIDELAQAQKRTEESLENFKKSTEENFNRVWKSIDELAEAQKKT